MEERGENGMRGRVRGLKGKTERTSCRCGKILRRIICCRDLSRRWIGYGARTGWPGTGSVETIKNRS